MNTGKMIFWICIVLAFLAIATFNTGCVAGGPNNFDAAVKRFLNQEDPPINPAECQKKFDQATLLQNELRELETKMRDAKGEQQTALAKQFQQKYLSLEMAWALADSTCGKR